MQIHKLTGASVGFAKIVLSATFNIIFASILTSIFMPKKDATEDVEHLVQSPNYNSNPCEKEQIMQLYPSVYTEVNKNHCRVDHDNEDQPTSPV